MVFGLEEIGEGGLSFEVCKSPKWLINMAEIAESNRETKLLSDIFFSANIEEIGGHLSVSGRLSFDLLSPCSRCLKPARSAVGYPIDFFLPLPQGPEAKGRRDNTIDISDDMREQVAMAMPEKLVCSGQCKGLCSRCGTDLNESACECETEKADSKFNAFERLALYQSGSGGKTRRNRYGGS